MEIGFLGGLGRAVTEPARANPDRLLAWNGRSSDLPCFLHGWGLQDHMFLWDGLALLIRGYLRPTGSRETPSRERTAEELRWRYLEEGLLDLDGLEGNATVILLDAQSRQALLARPANSSHPVYYQATEAGLLVGSNLAELASLSRRTPQVNALAVNTWLDLGSFPDGQTLFQDIARLLPGEMILWNEQGLQRGDLPHAQAVSTSRQQLVEVLRDCTALAARPVHLLTGSLASVLLQTMRNQDLAIDELLPATVSLCVDVPQAWDQTDAIMQASMILGTGHTLIPVPADAAVALRDTLAATGEPSACPEDLYLSYLAGAVRSQGHTTVILDAGGDSWPSDAGACWQRLWQTSRATVCFQQAGIETLCPLLDSRLFPGCDRFPLTRAELVRAMTALVPKELRRPQRPVALLEELLGPGKPLWPLVERIRTHDLISEQTLARARARPTEWLYRLLCYDLWHQLFLERSRAEERRPDKAISNPMPC